MRWDCSPSRRALRLGRNDEQGLAVLLVMTNGKGRAKDDKQSGC